MNIDIIEFVKDPQLLNLSLSPAQETLLRAIYGLPLSREQLDLFRECTGREKAPEHGFGEVTVLAGARSGKDSRIAAPIVVYEALFGGHEKQLARGERAVIPLVAQDRNATKIARDYIASYLTDSKVLASTIEEVKQEEITLGRVTILCFACTLRSLRGWSIPCGVMDELAFYRLEGNADSDVEIQTSIRRGMLNFSNPRLVKITTPYMRGGVVYDDFKAAFGQDDPDRLVWKASSILMNPSLKPERLERERRLDPLRFSREYEAEFADDVAQFLPTQWIDDAVVVGRHELPPQPGVTYFGAVDVAGGGESDRADAFTFAVCHAEGEKVVQDVMRGKRTRELEALVKEIAALAKSYRLVTVVGDKYARGWVRESYARAGVHYQDADRTKAEAFLDLQPLLAQGRIELLDHPILARELRLLEARPRQGGKTDVSSPRGAHDDFANALALAAPMAAVYAPVLTDLGRIGVRRTSHREGRLSVALDSGLPPPNRFRL